jgi:hypothetical protein
MIDGQKIRLGGEDWVVPPLTLGQIKRLAPQIALLDDAGLPHKLTAAQMDALAEIVAAALSRNCRPDDRPPTAEAVLELLDAGNATAAYVAVLMASGLRRDDAPGEREPVAEGSAGSSITSTEPSPPAAVIPSPRLTP